jgi:hypothetical protein
MAWYHPDGDDPSYDVEEPVELTDPEYPSGSTSTSASKRPSRKLAENSVDGPHFRYVHNTEIVPRSRATRPRSSAAGCASVQQFPDPSRRGRRPHRRRQPGPGFSITRFAGIVDTMLIGARYRSTPTARGAVLVQDRGAWATRRRPRASGRPSCRRSASSSRRTGPIWVNKAHVYGPRSPTPDPPFMKFPQVVSRF